MEEIDRLKSTMLSLIGHELRTPLNGMISSLEFLDSERPEDPATRDEMVHLALQGSKRLHHLIERVLELTDIPHFKIGDRCFMHHE